MVKLLEKIVDKVSRAGIYLFAALQLALPMKSFAEDVSLSGRVVNSQGVGQANKNVVLFLNNNDKKLSGVTGVDGVYVIPFTPSGIRHEYFLPEGYSVSNNYPNPFNPSTNVNITLPERSRVEMKVYDMLAQELGVIVDEELSAGVHYFRLDLEHLINGRDIAEGVYFVRTVIDEQYVKVNKLLFLRNSQHARAFSEVSSNGSSSNSFGKTSIEDIVDSLQVSGRSILPRSKTLGTVISGNTDLGDVVVDSAFNVDGRLISTIRYDQPNNHLPNLTVIIDGYSALTDSLGMFSVQVPVDSHVVEPWFNPWDRKMDIVDPSIWTRKKLIYIRGDTTDVIEDVLTRDEFPDSVMNFLNKISDRQYNGLYNVIIRFVDKPIFYIVADTSIAWDKEFYNIWSNFIKGVMNNVTKSRKYPNGFLENVIVKTGLNPPADWTPGYYVIDTSWTYGNAVLATSIFTVHPDGQPYIPVYARTIVGMYPTPMEFWYMKKALGHEIGSGLVYMPTRSNDLMSWYNLGNPNYPDITNPTKTDTLMLRYIFSRDIGVDYPDLDWDRKRYELYYP
ncbi:TPA: carboxypeptidase regulatory-like domain-containing protein [Candidatus Woesearchaeota archaeon]|nr:carboxypeptidase regulatory-like domain-containing protein [Candidatus Woesearchaeota archaeon]HIJ01690.1 carboxypeptidase regulatory-like domain-containing protein [Candidatus Woesearchaeota archaeon]HIJ13214.1 carboxypeptidase regulatory-like domain-containing protein [Candidatus Woesearchaeota archaeon]